MSNLPIHLYADSFTNIKGIPQDFIEPLTDRLTSLRKNFTNVESAKPDIMADTSMTEDGRLLALDKLYASSVEPLTESVRAAANALALSPLLANIKRNEVLAPSIDVLELALASEIRTRLASLAPNDRHREAERAATAGDRRLISAIVNAPAFLTGMDPEIVDAFRDQYIATHHPDIETLRQATEEAAGRSRRAIGELNDLRAMIFKPEQERRLVRIRARRASASRHLN